MRRVGRVDSSKYRPLPLHARQHLNIQMRPGPTESNEKDRSLEDIIDVQKGDFAWVEGRRIVVEVWVVGDWFGRGRDRVELSQLSLSRENRPTANAPNAATNRPNLRISDSFSSPATALSENVVLVQIDSRLLLLLGPQDALAKDLERHLEPTRPCDIGQTRRKGGRWVK